MPISFAGSDEVMVNATEMAKAFGKRVGDWLTLSSTKDYMAALIETYHSQTTRNSGSLSEETTRKSHIQTTRNSGSLIRTVEGRNGGTWMHEDVAIEFARWLDPKFAIWCNSIVKRIIKETIAAQNRLIESMETTMIPIISVSITMDDYAQVLSTYSGNEIGRTKLMDLLRKLGYIQKTSNLPYQSYLDRKFFVVVASGNHRPSARITPKGQRFVSRRLMRILPIRIPISIPLF